MKKIFYGYALVFLTLSFNGIDLLPDFFGYMLIAEGLKNLAAESKHFQTGRAWAIALFVYSLVWTLLQPVTAGLGQVLTLLIDLVGFAAAMYLLLRLDMGIAELEAKRGLDLGARGLMKLWPAQLGLALAASLTGLFAAVPASILSVAALSVNVIFLFRLSHIRAVLEE